MKKRGLLLVVIFLMIIAALHAKGKTDETEIKTHNDEWILCVTEFDKSLLPKEREGIADVISRTLVESIRSVNFRSRVSSEYAYYEDDAWYRQRLSAAKTLAAKQEERSLLLYKGDAGWKYRQDLAKLETDIEKLKADLDAAENEAPLINNEPNFKLTSGNLNMTFPQPPAERGELKFCQSQKADAFLTGTVMEFHGRFNVSVKLYTLYTKSYTYEDNVLFSPEDLDSAMDEIAKRLILTLSGNKPAAIVVKAEPQETLVLINRSFAGRGKTDVLEYPPGKVNITASAANHESIELEAELVSGELTEIDIRLNPFSFGNVWIDGTNASGSIYQGAMYAGETPLMLSAPLNILENIELNDRVSMRGTGVFYTPQQSDAIFTVSIPASKPQPEGRVDNARRWYYWAWGGTWITGIAAWVTYHSFLNYQNAAYSSGGVSPEFVDDYNRMYRISTGALIAVSAAALYEVFHIGRYIYIANKGSTPIIKTEKNKKEARKPRDKRKAGKENAAGLQESGGFSEIVEIPELQETEE